MAALTRFVSKSAEKAMPFLKVVRGNKKFECRDEQKQAFEQVKENLKKLPTIIQPKLGDKLQLYISQHQRKR